MENNEQPMPYSSRIKIERLKRSWTQEMLAEKINVSTRTIQRIENGAEASAHTLAALSDIFGISVQEFSRDSNQKHFRAPWDIKLKIITISICILFLITGIFSTIVIFYTLFGIILIAAPFTVTGYSVVKGKLQIHRLGWSHSFDLEDLTLLQHDKNMLLGSIRICGNGGLFAYAGKFRNTILGTYRAYLTNTENCLVLGFGEKKIAISPENPELLKMLIEDEIKKINS